MNNASAYSSTARAEDHDSLAAIGGPPEDQRPHRQRMPGVGDHQVRTATDHCRRPRQQGHKHGHRIGLGVRLNHAPTISPISPYSSVRPMGGARL
jgi:hypothetical protein